MALLGELGHDGDTALFFGLSGTGKTTLSGDALLRVARYSARAPVAVVR